jgi:hypothetical protein
MNFFGTLWADIQKLLTFAPIVAAISPQSAITIAAVTAAMAAIKPTIEAVQAVATAEGNPLVHADLVAKVMSTLTDTSVALVAQGEMSATTEDHMASVASLINAAVAVSGLAAQPV